VVGEPFPLRINEGGRVTARQFRFQGERGGGNFGEDESDEGVPHGSGGEKGSWVPVRGRGKWAAGWFSILGRRVPRGLFLYFYCFSSFPFLFSFLEFAY
jgi:hypothetical protein